MEFFSGFPVLRKKIRNRTALRTTQNIIGILYTTVEFYLILILLLYSHYLQIYNKYKQFIISELNYIV